MLQLIRKITEQERNDQLKKHRHETLTTLINNDITATTTVAKIEKSCFFAQKAIEQWRPEMTILSVSQKRLPLEKSQID